MTFAVLPAAGRSTRMGRPKLSLPLAGSTVLECVVGALRNGGVETVVVVVAPHSAELAPLAERAGAHVCRLAHETAQMRDTVEAGLMWIEEHFQPGGEADWLLVPADHPATEAAVVRHLLAARQDHPDASVLTPTYQGQRGHPVLISWRHVAGLRRLEAKLGLNVYLRGQPDRREVAVASDSILLDLDTPEDYARLACRVAPLSSTVPIGRDGGR